MVLNNSDRLGGATSNPATTTATAITKAPEYSTTPCPLFLIGLSLPNTMLTLMFSGGALDKPESSARIALKV
jgi:hypothetical protein